AESNVVSAGDDVSFTLTVTNDGNGRANDVTLTDRLPNGIDWAIDPDNESCEIAEGVLTCAIGTLESGGSFAVTVVGSTDDANCGFIANAASAGASNEAETDQANNSGSALIVV